MTAAAPSSGLRILHLTFASDAGGLSRYIHDLAEASRQAGHEVTVAGDVGAWQWLFDQAAFPYVKIPLHGGPLAFRRCAKLLRAHLASHPMDLIHTHYRRATLLGRQLQIDHRPPVLYSVHLSHLNLSGPRRWLSDFGDHTHVASIGAKEWVMQDGRVPEKQITIIPHGIDPAKFPRVDAAARRAARQALGLSDDDLVAVYMGRLDYPKNEEWLLDLAEQSRERLPNLRMLLVGEGPNERALRRRIAGQSLSERVRLLGHQTPLPIYQAADALLLPSLREGFSLACAEAMSVGIPVFRTHTSGSEELVVENVTGRTVPIDRQAFITGAMEFLADAKALPRMGAAAADHIRRHFTFDRQIAATLELYRRLCSAEKTHG